MSELRFRELTAEEFPVLSSIADGVMPDPKHGLAIVAEQDGEIVGRVFILSPSHVEGPWTAPAKRGGMLGAMLVRQAEIAAKKRGATKVFAYAASEWLGECLKCLGYTRSPMTVWEKEI